MTVRAPRFTFRLSFSEEPHDDLGCVTPRDHPFDVIHGDTRGTKRQTQGQRPALDEHRRAGFDPRGDHHAAGDHEL